MNNPPTVIWQPGPLPDPQEAQGRYVMVLDDGQVEPQILVPHREETAWVDIHHDCCDPGRARYDCNMVCLNPYWPLPENYVAPPFQWSWWAVKE